MDNKYEKFHKSAVIQKRIIKDNNYTYYEIIQTLKKILDKYEKLKILDYGCGVGTISLYLASRGHNVIGLDVSKNAIKAAKTNAKKLKLKNVKFFLADKINRNKMKKMFDLVLMIEVIEHVPDDKKVIKEVSSYLKKDGYLILTTPSIEAPLYKLGLLKSFDEKVGHLRRYTQLNLTQLVGNAEIKIIKFSVHESILRNFFYTNSHAGWVLKFIKGPISSLFILIEQPLIKLFGGSNYKLIGIKK